jgi:hypothetical protein
VKHKYREGVEMVKETDVFEIEELDAVDAAINVQRT